jgi:Heterokaryon incompatibility protein (HET)
LCINVHDTRIKSQRLPTRLLYIEHDKGPVRIRLCKSSDINDPVQYATLSHAWGSSDHLKLTTDSIERLLTGIPTNDLPQTFRHAVELVQDLSLHYLWIDALCILQDSKSDWEQESLTMSSVYSGAYINIAASASRDSNGGLFSSRNPLTITPCVVPVLREGKKYKRSVFWPVSAQEHVAHAPLNERAWVLQERLLALRTVHYTSKKIFWECPELLASETDPHSDFEYKVELSLTNKLVHRKWEQLPVHLRVTQCWDTWILVSKLYTAANLTFESDKLVAISGIAAYIHSLWPHPKPEYLAGLWSYKLIHNLLWFRDGPASTCTRLKTYQGPSWSWASISGGVSFMSVSKFAFTNDSASVLKVETTSTLDIFGPVKGGYIRIKGPLCAAKVIGCYNRPQALVHLEGLGQDVTIYEFHLDDGEADVPGDIYLFVLLSESSVKPPNVDGLLLKQNGEQKGQYFRIGSFTTRMLLDYHSRRWGQGTSTTDLELLQRGFKRYNPPESSFLESHEDHTYTIEII